MHACASLFRPLSAINSIVSDGKLAAGAIEIAIYVYKPSNGFNKAVARRVMSALTAIADCSVNSDRMKPSISGRLLPKLDMSWQRSELNACPYRKLKAADDRLRIG